MIRTAEPARWRVLIVDDHVDLRTALIRLISRTPEMEVVGSADSGESAIELALEREPGVVIMDVSMPGIGGIEATRRLTRLLPNCRVVGHSSHDGAELMRRAGAADFVAKGAPPQRLLDAIRGS